MAMSCQASYTERAVWQHKLLPLPCHTSLVQLMLGDRLALAW